MNFTLPVCVTFLDIYVNPKNRDYSNFCFKFQGKFYGPEDLCSDLLANVKWY
jgi:hypothetical protein